MALQLLTAACASGGGPPVDRRHVEGSALLPSRAERTKYRETATYADVVAFIESLTKLGRPIASGSIGTTSEGRAIPYVVVSRPLYASPQSARASGRPIVHIQGNIHAGEVEGKEALQALLRDLLSAGAPNVLDSIVLIAVPIYNADGNEKFDHQAKNRGAQNGPEMVGQRLNAAGLDLNRDYMKVDAPETRASLAMLNSWDPHVFVDLHTTNGSYHGYNLTYSPSLNPAAELSGSTFGGAFARDSLLPEIQRRTKARHGVATFPYGNFAADEGPSGSPKGWLTYDHRPRFGTNYYALRGRISILSEAYSHDPFETRVKATDAFVRELLSLVAERRATVIGLTAKSDAALASWDKSAPGATVPVRARLTTRPCEATVIREELEATSDTVAGEPGVRKGMRRTRRYRTEPMPVYDRFEPTLVRPVPWGYAVSQSDTTALRLLRAHGIAMLRVTSDWEGPETPQFAIDSAIPAARPFQGHREVRLVGTWPTAPTQSRQHLWQGTYIVPVAQPRGVPAMYLLEPESDDGLYAWDIDGRATTNQSRNSIVLLYERPPTAMERVP